MIEKVIVNYFGKFLHSNWKKSKNPILPLKSFLNHVSPSN